MQGKADMLVAKRTLSALTVVLFVMSAFAGLLFLAQPLPTRAQAIGDLTITSGTYTIENIDQPIDGNVNISGTGELVIRDGSLSVISNNADGQRHAINVRSGGTLTLEHGTVRTYPDQIDPYPFLDLTIDTGGHLVATEGSVLMFPGHIYINSGALVSLTDSTTIALPSADVSKYVLGSGGTITTDMANDGPAISVSGSGSTLQLFDSTLNALPEYPTESLPASNLLVSGGASLLAVNSYIGVDFDNASAWTTHNALVLSGTSIANLYGCRFEPSSASEARTSAIETSSTSSAAYIYRWLNVTIGDEYGVPISGVAVSAVFTGPTMYENQTAFYFWPGSVQDTPPIEVLNYMGKNSSSYSTTGPNGVAQIPYLSDLILGELAPYPLFIGALQITGSATIGSIVYENTETFAFPAYPAMGDSDQFFDATVELMDVSAFSPDQSRWLVVPVSVSQPSLTISDMTFYHAGDVIVAANGLLKLDQATFQLIQASPNQRTIFVDGTASNPGRLLVQDSVMTSSLPINIIVKGYGILEIDDSELIGINIIAQGNSQVILRNATVDGTITTSWDSHASISVSDSELQKAPVLSGYSRGGFTNTSIESVPSIKVEDSAYAQIFRWILVWVYDGAGQPLANATVEARHYVEETPAVSAMTDLTGVARLNCLGTNITSAGRTIESNYRVNATYTYNARVYNATEDLSVGVMPYSEPLGRNATYVTMVIPSVKPDLAIHTVPVPIEVDPAYPLRGSTATVRATIHNDGVSGAYNVQVNFYDIEYEPYTGVGLPNTNFLFSVKYIDYIAPGQSKTVETPWDVDYPYGTGHTLVVAADPENKILEMNENLSLAIYSLPVPVKALPDLTAYDYQIRCEPDPEIDKQIKVSAVIWNRGDLGASVPVEFYNDSITPQGYMGNMDVTLGGLNSYATAYVMHTFSAQGPHRIYVVIDPFNATEESNEANNQVWRDIEVYPHPDLEMSSLWFELNETSVVTVSGDDEINIVGALRNIGLATVPNPEVTIWINETHGTHEMKTVTVDADLSGWWYWVEVVYEYKVPRLLYAETVDVTMIVNNARSTIETDYSNNWVTNSFNIRDDRPDLTVSSADIQVMRDNRAIESDSFGSTVSVVMTVKNLGNREATFKLRVNVSQGAYNYTIKELTSNISSNATDDEKIIAVSWTVGLWIQGESRIWVWLDPTNELSEKVETNNLASKVFAISQMRAIVIVTTDTTEYRAGETMVVTASIQYQATSTPVKNLPGVIFYLVDRGGNRVGESDPATTDGNGGIEEPLIIPLNLEGGSYTVTAVVAGMEYPELTTVEISSAVQGGIFPLWVWIVIIIAVVAVVAGFTMYTYIYGLGKLVECGECGAFIPAASKRCPKCGVEFEAGTMKCSECGAWIPADSAECPNCGVKFLGEVEDEADYMERMRKEYDELVSKYRELAKMELGKKFSDREFENWWRTQPGYITFDDWLAKEEEKKKEGPVPCPVCGTLNPKEATVCHKCGTVFAGATTQVPGRKGPPPAAPAAVTPAAPAQPEAGAQQQPPGAPPRMVIRRPIDRKVVPKKIIKTPLGTEEKVEGGEENNEENQ